MNQQKEIPKSKLCVFYADGFGSCNLLYNTHCDGAKDGCAFRKTATQFRADADSAIMLCRKKGLCDGCKYKTGTVKCKLSTE